MKSYDKKEIIEPVDVDEEDVISVEELLEASEEQVKASTVLGVVTECVKLRVRSTPEVADNVICEILLASEVLVDLDESTEEYYKVTTEFGVKGYCMKQYINIGK